MKKTLIISGISIVGLVLWFVATQDNGKLGGMISGNAYSGGVTNSSTTLVGGAATSILAKNVDRQWAKICNDGSGVVWIHEIATATGVVVNQGLPIASSTVYEHCYTIDTTHPYIGQVYGITSLTTTIKYIEK